MKLTEQDKALLIHLVKCFNKTQLPCPICAYDGECGRGCEYAEMNYYDCNELVERLTYLE